MTVGKQTFTGKGAREEAGNALVRAVMSWRDDQRRRCGRLSGDSKS